MRYAPANTTMHVRAYRIRLMPKIISASIPNASPPETHWQSANATSAESFSYNRLPARLTAYAMAVAGYIAHHTQGVAALCPWATEPFSPNGLVRERNNIPCPFQTWIPHPT